MRVNQRQLKQLQRVRRHHYHPLIHKLHKKHRISHKTLFYIKEYGPKTHVAGTIIRESVKILLLASIISSLGGLSIEHIKTAFLSIMPLVILMPALNDMIGDFGSIVSSRFSTMLYEGKVSGSLFKNQELRTLFLQISILALSMAVLGVCVAVGVSLFSHAAVDALMAVKILLVTILDVVILISIIFAVSIIAGIYFFQKGEDPNNFLIPITTSIADFGNLLLLAVLVVLFF
ncbi:MAG: magnesium transporter [Candidatus Aenigmarchaeota archaeon]|nr:magnesium transporter [Candidatus Aenigmarchaeota archaeon]